ncbi:hypothetical protein ACF1CG_36955 [Streptomyces sp. NPDC014773]|uniref:hypothetical protein n=1 Tax=Streptomyces sp. NPDC014773 TaxID=3364908 RepID=UPI0036FDFBE4
MYSLASGYRLPALQRGLSPAEIVMTRLTAGAGGAVLASALIDTPPVWTLGAIGAAVAVLNVAPGPRSLGRWAAVGYRHLRERTAPASMTDRPGLTASWTIHPDHGTMQDPARRQAFHGAFARALAYAGGQTRTGGVQVHVTHHATVREYTTHAQTLSVHIPKGIAGDPQRIIATLEGEFARVGVLAETDPGPAPEVTGRGPGWVVLEDGRYAATARITSWPDETGDDLMARLLLGQAADRSLAVLYRPLPARQSHRAALWQSAAAAAFTTDKVKRDADELATASVHGALVQGATLVDLDAYLTVWGDSPGDIADQRRSAALLADRFRIGLDWLTGQQHRAHLMTTAHGASTRKGAVL